MVRHTGTAYDDIVLIGGMSKAYSSLLAFVACAPAVKRQLKITAPTYLYSEPVPIASLATALAGLDVNADRGDALRARLYGLTRRVLDHLAALGVTTANVTGFPLVEVPLREPELLRPVARALLDAGICTTLAPYPGVPRDEVGFRIQLTAANTQVAAADAGRYGVVQVDGDTVTDYAYKPEEPAGDLVANEVSRILSGAELDDAYVAPGAVVRGTVRGSVLGPGVVVEAGATVVDSVVLGDAVVRSGARVIRAVLDERTDVGTGARVGTAGGELTVTRRDTTVAPGSELDGVPDE